MYSKYKNSRPEVRSARNDERIGRAYLAFDKWKDSFDPPLNEMQRGMLINTLFEMQRITRDECAKVADDQAEACAHGASNSGEIWIAKRIASEIRKI